MTEREREGDCVCVRERCGSTVASSAVGSIQPADVVTARLAGKRATYDEHCRQLYLLLISLCVVRGVVYSLPDRKYRRSFADMSLPSLLQHRHRSPRPCRWELG